MKNIVIGAGIALLLIIAFFVFSKSEAQKTFENFGDAWARARAKDARPLMEGPDMEKLLKEKSVMETVEYPMGTVGKVAFKNVTKAKDSDGNLEYSADLTVYFNPPGVESAVTATMYAKLMLRATLKDTDNGWKVVSIDPELVDIIEKNLN